MADPMAEKKANWIKTARWIYWTVTLLFVVTMMSAGLTYLAGASFNVEGITHLGYPAYLLKILGTAKLLGGIAIL
jgi:DoxX-like family